MPTKHRKLCSRPDWHQWFYNHRNVSCTIRTMLEVEMCTSRGHEWSYIVRTKSTRHKRYTAVMFGYCKYGLPASTPTSTSTSTSSSSCNSSTSSAARCWSNYRIRIHDTSVPVSLYKFNRMAEGRPLHPACNGERLVCGFKCAYEWPILR